LTDTLNINALTLLTLLLTGSNHYGIAGFYSLQAMEAGLLVRWNMLISIFFQTFNFRHAFTAC